MASKREAALKRRCVRMAVQRGWTHIRLHFGAGSAVGWPDDLFMRRHRHIVFVEFKDPDGTPSPMQLHRKRCLEAMGFDSLLIDNEHDFDAWIR